MKIEGVWLPIVTPFLHDAIDFGSYKNIIDHYVKTGISGIIPLGTTGESPAVSDYEFEGFIDKTIEYVDDRLPIFVGLGGNCTAHVVKSLATLEKYDIAGILSVSPYYNRPDQRGIYEHFLKIAEATRLNIIVYNIPYRTGRNIENDTIYKLADLDTIIGIKDSCGDIKQSMELLLNPPPKFSIMTGEDLLYFSTLCLGGSGGILASAHLYTEDFIDIFKSIRQNDHGKALGIWKKLSKIIPLFFAEPNPAPIKYCLKKLGLIQSAETRLPLMDITQELENKLDAAII
ncbi:MAG TPA: 4-hydroxy-tetrahydrodipicolinate synthase [Chitinivibrionales bacterium]